MMYEERVQALLNFKNRSFKGDTVTFFKYAKDNCKETENKFLTRWKMIEQAEDSN